MKKELKFFADFLPYIKAILQKDIMASVVDHQSFIAYVPGDSLDVKLKVGSTVRSDDPILQTVKQNKPIVEVVPKEVYGIPFRSISYPIRNKKGECIGAIAVAESLDKEHTIKETLDGIMVNISQSNSGLAAISSEVNEMSVGIQELSSVVQEVNASIVEISELSEGISSSVDSVAHASKTVIKEAKNGIDAIKNINKTLDVTVDEIINIRTQIEHLSAAIDNANKTVSLINSIAEQTNLLALNASIEAARAGEHGRGFAVVADEVGKLAVQSKESSVEISDMMKGIQVEIKTVVEKVLSAVDKTEGNRESITTATTNIEVILKSIEGVDSEIQGVRTQINQQTKNTNEIRLAVDSITSTVDEKASSGLKINQMIKAQSAKMADFEKNLKHSSEALISL